MMNYQWRDYEPCGMTFVEAWLDEQAVAATGLDEGFRSFYEYWAKEEGFVPGENFWCKVVFEKDIPLAVAAFCRRERTILIMELLVDPKKRGCGIGTRLLQELLGSEELIGSVIERSEAVIFPENLASQRACQKAGYYCHHCYEDGSALLYVYERPAAKNLRIGGIV